MASEVIWNELLCDVCGMRSPGLTGRPRATLIRSNAGEYGWTRVELNGAVRDVCPTCERLGHSEMAKVVSRRGNVVDECSDGA